MKRLYVIIGPSGAGKTTIENHLIEKHNMKRLVSTTTREIRSGEKQGEPLYYVSKKQFETLDLVQRDEHNFEYYGITKEEIVNKVNMYDNIVFVGNSKSVEQIKNLQIFDKVTTIYLDVTEDILKRRMKKRGDSESSIEKRLLYDKKHNKNSKENVDYIIQNIDLNITKEKIDKIILKI